MTTSIAMPDTFSAVSQPPGAERRVEFNHQVRREFQNGQRDNEAYQYPLVYGRDCAGKEHERENEVQCNSPWA